MQHFAIATQVLTVTRTCDVTNGLLLQAMEMDDDSGRDPLDCLEAQSC